MVKRDARLGLRLIALLALLMLALGAASCGDDDDDGGNGGGGDAAAQGQSQDDGGDPVPVDNSPEGQIRAAHTKFIEVFYEKDPGPICDLLSRKGQRDWTTKKAKTCEEGVESFFNNIQDLGKKRPRITDVRVDGNQALANTRVKGSAVYPVPFIKENGEWKINAGGL
jgi:hypothetical protein